MTPQPAARLAGTSSARRTLDTAALAALRPAAERATRPRKPREPAPQAERVFFCSNPQCDHATWAPADQAVHMAQEFWAVAQALIRLAPDSPEALRLTGGVILTDLTDDQCRSAAAAYQRLRRQANGTDNGRPVGQMTMPTYLAYLEYGRRVHAGILSPATERATPPEREHCPRCGAPWVPENVYRGRCRACARRKGAAAARARRARKAPRGSAAAVRAWLAGQGRESEVPAHGPVPAWAREAYEQAARTGTPG